MKKAFLLGVAVLLSFGFSAETLAESGQPSEIYLKNYQKRKAHQPSAKMRAKVAKFMDTKLYHDPYYVSQIADGMQQGALNQNKLKGAKREEIKLNGLYSDKDADALGKSINSVQVTTKNKPNFKKEMARDPHGAYVDLLMNQTVNPLELNTMNQIQSVDKNTLKEAQEMATSAGPEFGAKAVAVRYQG